MFYCILVSVGKIEKVREERRYEQVTFETEKPEYRHVLTHGPSRQVPDIHNSSRCLDLILG